MKLTLSIVILNWNTSGLLRNCIRSIQEFTNGLSYEIIVVDNGSSDGSQKMVREELTKVRLIETGDNLGFSRGNNIGIRAAKGEFILILNSDTLLKDNALLPWVEFLRNNDRAAGAICRTERIDGSLQSSFLRFPTVFTEWLFLSFAALWRGPFAYPRSKYMLDVDSSRVQVADWISGCAMMLKKEVIDEAGDFDEKIFLFYEDTELCYRINKVTGKLFYYFPGSRIVHLGGGSYAVREAWQSSYCFRSACYFLHKTLGMRSAKRFRLATRFSWALVLVVFGFLSLLTVGASRWTKRKFGYHYQLLRTRANCLSGTT